MGEENVVSFLLYQMFFIPIIPYHVIYYIILDMFAVSDNFLPVIRLNPRDTCWASSPVNLPAGGVSTQQAGTRALKPCYEALLWPRNQPMSQAHG